MMYSYTFNLLIYFGYAWIEIHIPNNSFVKETPFEDFIWLFSINIVNPLGNPFIGHEVGYELKG